MSDTSWARAVIAAACADALALVFPVMCAGCGEIDVALCEECAAALVPDVRRSRGSVAVWSGLSFEAVPARVMRALKQDGRTSLARAFAPALRAAFEAARAASGGAPLLAVPVPTSRASYRRRGYRVVELIARRAGVPTARVLHVHRRVRDQRGLGRQARRDNIAFSLSARDAAGLRVVVIDDVVTTGATLDEAVRALREGGAEVVGAVTVARTLRHSERR